MTARITVKYLENRVDHFNSELVAVGSRLRFEVGQQNGYTAIDEYQVDVFGNRIGSGVDCTTGSGSPRECLSAMERRFSRVKANHDAMNRDREQRRLMNYVEFAAYVLRRLTDNGVSEDTARQIAVEAKLRGIALTGDEGEFIGFPATAESCSHLIQSAGRLRRSNAGI